MRFRLISIVSLVFAFALMFPVQAAPGVPLESLTTTLAQPILSADWDTDPSYTNVTYTWTQTHSFIAETGDPCIAAESCANVRIILQDDVGTTTTHQNQEWMSSIVPSDIIWDGPANSSVSTTVLSDDTGNGRYEELDVVIACSDACTFATSTTYSLTIVNSPIKNQIAPTPYIPGVYSTTTQEFSIRDFTDLPVEFTEFLTSIVAVGKGLTVTASADPILTFYVTGVATSTVFYTDTSSVSTVDDPDNCSFGTLTAGIPKVCLFQLHIATNASNGYAIYVVQDQNMTFNGNAIKQFYDGTRINYSEASTWAPPSAATLAHLGYSSNDTTVLPSSFGNARWAGIPKISTSAQTANTSGLVANSPSPGTDQWIYAIKVESAATLPQGTAYTHNEYFLVVGNF